MTREEFRRYLMAGHGRAMLFLQRHSPTPFRDDILEVCLAEGWDPFLAGAQDRYLIRAIKMSGHEAWLRSALLDAARRRTGTPEMTHYLEAITIGFALEGDADFAALARSWSATCEGGSRMTPLRGAVLLDGPAGFVTVARNFGRQLAAGKKSLSYDAQSFFGADSDRAAQAMMLAREAALTDSDVRRYVEWADGYKSRCAAEPTAKIDSPPVIPPYEEISRRIRERDTAVWGIYAIPRLQRWAQLATDDDMARLAADLDPSSPDDVVREQLAPFRIRPFPADPSVLVGLTEHEDLRISGFAMKALRKIRHPRCREIAWKAVAAGRWRMEVFALLWADLTDDDLRRLVDALPAAPSEWDVTEICHAASATAARAPLGFQSIGPLLLWGYDRAFSATSRERLVRGLASRGFMTREIAEECLQDSSETSQAIAREWLAGKTIKPEEPSWWDD